MRFEEWWDGGIGKPVSVGYDCAKEAWNAAYLAGQSSAEERVKELEQFQKDLIAENRLLCAKVEFQKTAWTQEHNELMALQARVSELERVPDGWLTLGVGNGGGNLFVHGDYESIKACQAKLLGADQRYGQVTPTYDELVAKCAELERERDEFAQRLQWVKDECKVYPRNTPSTPAAEPKEIEHLRDLLGKANALCRIRQGRIKELARCIERMRVAGDSYEFQMAFELAKDAIGHGKDTSLTDTPKEEL